LQPGQFALQKLPGLLGFDRSCLDAGGVIGIIVYQQGAPVDVDGQVRVAFQKAVEEAEGGIVRLNAAGSATASYP
jgi:hypothetical protein